ncbi:protein translocase subunit SecD [Aliikangiella sp. IMCC44653]
MFSDQPQLRPINTFPAWKYVMLAVILALGILYALPNMYGENFAVQVSGEKGAAVPQQVFLEIENVLKEKNISLLKSSNEQGKALYRFEDSEIQLKAKDVIDEYVKGKSEEYGVALNLVAATPEWLKNLGGSAMKLGLDLRGGVHFLMEVDMKSAIAKKETQYLTDFKTTFRENKLRYSSVVKVNDVGMVARFRDEETRDKAEVVVRQNFAELNTRSRETGNMYEVVITIPDIKIKEIKDYAVKQNIATLRNRINQLGVAEPLIQQQGAERILIQLPGVQDSAQAKRILGSTATVEFRLVSQASGYNPSSAGPGAEIIEGEGDINYAIRKSVIVDGTHLTDATVGYDENAMPQINVTLDGEGGNKMLAVTSKNINKPMAIIMIESRGVYEVIDGENKLVSTKEVKSVVSAPNIGSALGSKFRITGQFTPTEAHELALVLRSGSMIAPVYFVEERTVGPSLGKQNIELGKKSIMVGFFAVLIFMALYYRVFGLIANVALMSNLVFIFAIMSLVPGATLTLPGIAGIVLTVGMAVDANVLIFERIREELSEGTNPAQAIHNGYDKAFSTIADANVTTLIAALVLFSVGTGPVAGFAVTLLIGIMTSMFTAIIGSRALVNLVYGGKALKKISI